MQISTNKTQEEIIASLQQENRLLQEAARFFEEKARLFQEENRLFREVIHSLKERIAELERHSLTNSTTSSKPPSSDGLTKQARKPLSLRGEGKPKGGQKGHQGKTMQQSSSPDQVIVHEVHTCADCGADLKEVPFIDTIKRQTFDVIIQRNITEHQAQVKCCTCKAYTTASFPPGVKAPVQIGDDLRSIILYLSEQFIAKDRLSQVIEDLFSISLSDTTILKYEGQLAGNLKTFEKEALVYLQQNAVKHGDETGMRVGGKTQWMHTLCDPFVTYLWHQPNRKCLLKDLKGVLVHDHYQSYLQIDVSHAFCNAHILRELKALIEYEKEPWALDMFELLRNMCHDKNEGTLDDRKIDYYQILYDKIVDRGLDYHEKLTPLPKPARGRNKRRIGHNLLIRLKDFKAGILLFLTDTQVPFTNNQAEQALRMVKVKQKVSGSFRTLTGVQNFATIRSYIATVRKNGGNVFEAIKLALKSEVYLSQIFNPYNLDPVALSPPS
jgi:transposase